MHGTIGRVCRRVVAVSVLTLTTLTTSTVLTVHPASATTNTVTQYSWVSSPGDPVGGGGSGSFSSPGLFVSMYGTQSHIHIDLASPSVPGTTQIDFVPGIGGQLLPGDYPNAMGYPANGNSPGILVIQSGVCLQVGSFSIWSLETDPHGDVVELDASFVAHCGTASTPPLTGHVEINAPQSPGQVVLTSAHPEVVQGEPTTLSAYAPGVQTGLVSFFDGGHLLGTAPISDGIASLTASFDQAGNHSLSASASGSSLADSDPVTETVDDNSTSFWFTSVAGSAPGGAAGSYTPAADPFSVIGTLGSINIDICSPSTPNCFTLFLSPPLGQQFAPGAYSATTFSLPPPPNTAGFIASYGASVWFGPATFIIHSIGTAADGTINELDVSVSSVCDVPSISGTCFTGEFRYNVPDADLTIGTAHDIATPATSPAGATATYPTPTVSDPDDVDVPTAVCNPASGSNFPIGLTTVTCSVTGVDDTPSTATTTFTVAVEGAAPQLLDLAKAVQGVGPGTSLRDKVHTAQASLNSGDTGETCSGMAAFALEVHAQAAKTIPAPQAAQLIANAQRIRAVLAC